MAPCLPVAPPKRESGEKVGVFLGTRFLKINEIQNKSDLIRSIVTFIGNNMVTRKRILLCSPCLQSSVPLLH